jgi:hypothetical protein
MHDQLGTTPLLDLQATLSQDLYRICDLRAKLDGLADASL